MRAIALCLLAILASCASTGSDSEAPAEKRTPDIAGQWKGALEVGPRRIPFVFNVSRADSGRYTATLDSPEEGAYGIEIETVNTGERNVVFEIPVVSAEFEATLDQEGDTLSGVWRQRGVELDLEIERQTEPTSSARPQDPEPPFPYRVEEITFINEADGIELGGTLTIPEGSGPFPGVVLISGSGQQNRDEELFNHRPFLVAADAMTRAGIAVLRYDDRGVGESDGAESLDGATGEDFARDTAAALTTLRNRPEVDASATGLLGHSEGGIIAASLAAEDPGIAFVVLLAAPGVPGAELLMMQSRAILEASGVPEATIDALGEANRRIYEAIEEHPEDEAAAEAVTSIMRELGMSKEQIEAQRGSLLSAWYRHFLSYDPAQDLERLTMPVLAVNGTLDTQVPAEQNLAAIEAALEKAPTDTYRTMALEELNHLFQPAATGLQNEYGTIDITLSPELLELVTNWVHEVTE